MPAQRAAKAHAAAYVDAQHHRAHVALKVSHQRWERHELNHHRNRIGSIKEHEAVINARFVARSQTIENKKANMARIIDRQHKSLAGRIDRMMPGGRARQAATWQRFEQRAASLHLRAAQKHQVQLERHYQTLQQARVSGNRDWMGFRGQNRDALADHKRQHIEHRPNKIHARMREMERARIVQLRPELKHQFRQQAHQQPSKTVQKPGLSRTFPQQANLKHNFRQQADRAPSQTIQRGSLNRAFNQQVTQTRQQGGLRQDFPRLANLKSNFRQQANRPPSKTVQRGHLTQNFRQQANRPPSKTIQRGGTSRAFNQQANKPPSQTIQHKR